MFVVGTPCAGANELSSVFAGLHELRRGIRYDERRTPNKHGALWVAIALAFALTACTTRSSSADLIDVNALSG